MPTIEKHIVPILSTQERLSDYTVGIFDAVSSRKGIKKAIKKEWITINGSIGYSGDYLLGGELLVLNIQEESKPQLQLELEVLYEDDHLAIINKLAGISVSGNKAHTIQNALSYNLQTSSQTDALALPQPVHRLDHPTSGVLLIGKTRSMVTALGRLFQHRSIHKVYHAIAIGKLDTKGMIDSSVDHKEAKTTFQVIKSIPSDRFTQLSLLELSPHTGRRHQLRKHLASIGTPILGDPLYYKEGLLLKGKGLYLHASSLEFEHPINGEIIKVESELPKKFLKIMSNR